MCETSNAFALLKAWLQLLHPKPLWIQSSKLQGAKPYQGLLTLGVLNKVMVPPEAKFPNSKNRDTLLQDTCAYHSGVASSRHQARGTHSKRRVFYLILSEGKPLSTIRQRSTRGLQANPSASLHGSMTLNLCPNL